MELTNDQINGVIREAAERGDVTTIKLAHEVTQLRKLRSAIESALAALLTIGGAA